MVEQIDNIKKKLGKKTIERAAMILIALVTIGLVIFSQRFEGQLANQKVMFFQLQALRTSVNLFKAMTRVNPKDLKELLVAEYSFPDESQRRRYIEFLDIDDKGRVLDPFGNAYVYDQRTGWVMSSTSGFEYW